MHSLYGLPAVMLDVKYTYPSYIAYHITYLVTLPPNHLIITIIITSF